ncbi:hypothetical protein ACE1TI_06790 [Alteribacillus sp. JSM 102045]|uniref:hypothetical protein n=1 Tax=Alteribacillus sp. JSM 102045 TaxID=1562101 RepID=UPI0035C1DDBB
MKAKIRPMVEADIKNVQHVAWTSWHDTYEGLIPEEVQDHFLTNAYSDERMKQRLDHCL